MDKGRIGSCMSTTSWYETLAVLRLPTNPLVPRHHHIRGRDPLSRPPDNSSTLGPRPLDTTTLAPLGSVTWTSPNTWNHTIVLNYMSTLVPTNTRVRLKLSLRIWAWSPHPRAPPRLLGSHPRVPIRPLGRPSASDTPWSFAASSTRRRRTRGRIIY